MPPAGQLLLRGPTGTAWSPVLETETGHASQIGDSPPLRCAACRCPITTRQEAVVIEGSHDHSRVNPMGLAFHFGCFRQAPGCLTQGEATSEFSWFAGYQWCFALCRGCHTHLGWHYASATDSFFGLIHHRLSEDPAAGAA